MKILHVADLHLDHDWFDWVAGHSVDYDLLVIAGDNEDRGDDPGVIMANSAPAGFPSSEEAPKITNTHELADFAEDELAKNRAASPLPPTKGYASWLDYALGALPTRELYHDHLCGNQAQWPNDVSRRDFEAAAKGKLNLLRGQRLSHGRK